MDKTAIRHASTVILVRDADSAPAVLMGQRGAKAAFMPSKFVFPGGAVDSDDAHIAFGHPANPACAKKLAIDARGIGTEALLAAAIREVWEETGLRIGTAGIGTPDGTPDSWLSYFGSGAAPDARPLRFFFRAITPPGRPRRFDARFFIAPVEALMDDPDDFSNASDELSHLQWVPLAEVRSLDLPFITEVVMGELSSALPDLSPPKGVPFFHHDDQISRFQRL